MKVAIVYDRVNKWGGAERVLENLHKIFPDAPLFTSVYNKKSAAWAKVFPDIKTTFLQRLPLIKSNHEFFATFMPIAFESFDFSDYDLVISVTSEAAKGIITQPKVKHICYCLTPTRYLWSHSEIYQKNPIFKFVSSPFYRYLKRWDLIAAQRPDVLIAISAAVKERIKTYYLRESSVIYPPATSLKISREIKNSKRDYFLVVSRLVSYKRVDLAVRVFNELGYPLVVIGHGRQKTKLKLIAKKNIKFIDYVNDEVLRKYYLGAKALIVPQEEDFGIAMVEALSCATPVIAYKKGGALDIIAEDQTGIFFEKQTIKSLRETLLRFGTIKFDKGRLIKSSIRFSNSVFRKKILDFIANL